MITAEQVRKLLHYNPETGEFRWLMRRRGVKSGSVTGYLRKDGYWRIQIYRHRYMANRLAWLYMTGEWPAEEIDHINGVPGDDRWENLREASHSQNMHNSRRPRHNTSGVKGVSWFARDAKWKACIQVNKRRIHLGYFTDLGAARAAYAAAAAKYHGEFGRLE